MNRLKDFFGWLLFNWLEVMVIGVVVIVTLVVIAAMIDSIFFPPPPLTGVITAKVFVPATTTLQPMVIGDAVHAMPQTSGPFYRVSVQVSDGTIIIRNVSHELFDTLRVGDSVEKLK
jgi:hypothetical protein